MRIAAVETMSTGAAARRLGRSEADVLEMVEAGELGFVIGAGDTLRVRTRDVEEVRRRA